MTFPDTVDDALMFNGANIISKEDYTLEVVPPAEINFIGSVKVNGETMLAADTLPAIVAGVNSSGVFADRPIAQFSNIGYTYFATDKAGGTMYRSNGSSWIPTGPGVADTYSVVFLPATDFYTVLGTPVLAPVGTSVADFVPAWSFPFDSNAAVSAFFRLPDGWLDFDIDLLWCKMDTTNGDWYLAHTRGYLAVGSDVGSVVQAEATAVITVPAGATPQYDVVATNLRVDVNGTNVLQRVTVQRKGANVADTYAGSIALLGVRVTRSA